MQMLGKYRGNKGDRVIRPAADGQWTEIAYVDVADLAKPPSIVVEPAGVVDRCGKCGADFLWLDHEGGHHCPVCEEPPSLAMVERVVRVFVGSGGERLMEDRTEMCMPIWHENRRQKLEARAAPSEEEF
jgi:hypothetical protein